MVMSSARADVLVHYTSQVVRDLGDRLSRLRHDAYRPLTKLRRELATLLRHDNQHPLLSRTPRYEGNLTPGTSSKEPAPTCGSPTSVLPILRSSCWNSSRPPAPPSA